eukprot:scaffold163_cov142-Isochrysis_galbana.AAC.1
MPLVGDKGGGGSGRHRGGRLASPVRGLLTQLTHKRHVRAPDIGRPGGGTGRSLVLVPRAFASPRATHTGYWLPLARPTLPRPARRSAAWMDDIHDTSAPIRGQTAPAAGISSLRSAHRDPEEVE